MLLKDKSLQVLHLSLRDCLHGLEKVWNIKQFQTLNIFLELMKKNEQRS